MLSQKGIVTGGIGVSSLAVTCVKGTKMQMTLNTIILRCLGIMVISGCTATPVQKLQFYGCHYFFENHGFCCEKQIPEYDKYILTCEYGNQLSALSKP